MPEEVTQIGPNLEFWRPMYLQLDKAHVLVIAIARIEGPKVAKPLRESKRKREELARKLCRDANIDLSNGGGRLELAQFQKHLQEYKITVYNDRDGQKHINLHLDNNHQNDITNTKAYFACRYYCDACYKHCDILHPRCELAASTFQFVKPKIKLHVVTVIACSMNQKIHAPNQRKTACEIQKGCPDCGTYFFTDFFKQELACNEHFCQFCSKFVPPNHNCYMKTGEIKKQLEYVRSIATTQFIFYDLETTQTKHDPNTGLVHEVNLCYIDTAFHLGIEQEDFTKQCEKCGERAHCFEGNNCIGEYLDYMTTTPSSKNFKKVICIAHNAKSYDFVLACQYIMNHE
ncbi:hypothetical protein B566_EDAN016012 [Ephemera danica]|nr:hypothetical protein B566_EDAN016012 [Ephemera danica]